MPLHFRNAMPADAAALSTLAQIAKAHWGYPAAWLAAWEDDLTFTNDYLAAHRVLVAERNGQIVGVCAIEDHETHWALGHLWVAPAQHGQGIGTQLVQRALAVAAARPARPVCVVSDPNAAKFYERLGGARTGTVAAPMPGAPDRTLPTYEFRR